MIEVRRVRAGEGQQLKTLRLRALADSPEAFQTRLEDAERLPDEQWSSRAERAALAQTTTTVVACEGEDWLGMAAGYLEPDQAEAVEFVSLWLDPARRRSGIATALIDAVAQWARERGAKRLQLRVVETNTPARNLYARLGFTGTDHAVPLPSNPSLRDLEMILDL